MRKIYFILAALLAVGCSIDRQEDFDLPTNGLTTLIVINNIEVGSDLCSDGGVSISLGIDTNSNGVLESDEITQVVNLCNGADGMDGTNGTNGTNGQDGQNGTDGNNGTDGTDGQDGYSSLVNIVDFEENESCPQGGVIIFYGTDLNRNGILEEDEVQGSTTICNGDDGQDGEDGTNGTDGQDGNNGSDGNDGADGEDGADGQDGSDGSDGEDGEDGQDGQDGQDGDDECADCASKGKVLVKHFTGSESNPYEYLCIPPNAAKTHENHHNDIICQDGQDG